MLFAKEMQRRLLESGSRVRCNSFGPGLITRSGFFRNQNPFFVKLFDVAANDVFKVATTVSDGGDCLVRMVSDSGLEGVGGLYFNNDISGYGKHTFAQAVPSTEAQNEEEARRLWLLSAKLVGMKPDLGSA